MSHRFSLFFAEIIDPRCGKAICADDTNIPTSTPTIGDAFEKFAAFGLSLLGIIAVLVLVIAGIQFVTSGGNPSKTKQAREAILYALIGIAFAVGAYGIVMLITTRIG